MELDTMQIIRSKLGCDSVLCPKWEFDAMQFIDFVVFADKNSQSQLPRMTLIFSLLFYYTHSHCIF